MAKLPMCRICLIHGVRMFVVADENLQEIYEKLTDIPFVTEDCTSMLACFFCYSKLKQCYALQKKCLEAAQRFAKMVREYEPKPVTIPGISEFVGGFVRTPVQIISIVGGEQADTESVEILELPPETEQRCNIVEIKIERESDGLGPEDLRTFAGVSHIQRHLSESDSEDDVPLREFKTEVVDVKEENKATEVSKEIEKVKIIKQAPVAKKSNLLDVTSTAKQKKPGASDSNTVQPTKIRVPVAKKTKLTDVTSSAKQKKTGPTNSNTVRPTKIRTPKSVTKLKKPTTISKPTIQNDSEKHKINEHVTEVKTNLLDYIHSAIDTSFCNKNDLKTRILNNIRIENEESSRRQKLGAEGKVYKCEICQECFSEKGILRKHFLEHGEKPFKCQFCQRGFDAKCYLDKHVRIHTGEKPYKCDECQRSFSEKSNLIKHIRIHTGDKPYKCEVCQRSFNQKCQLTSHSLLHTGEKPYKCDICHQGFNRLYNFNQHYRIHTGEKPHSCLICQRTFAQKTSLTKHLRKHTGEKPYKCFVCQRSYPHKQSLDMHFRKHTGEKPFKCVHCKRCFTQGSHLKQHLRIHADDDKAIEIV